MLGAQRCIDQSASPRQGSFPGTFSRLIISSYPANFPGLGEALIFFCCFSSIKGRKEGGETPRNSRFRCVAKKKRGVIPDYRPISSKRQALFAPGSIHSQARDTEKRLPISHTRPTRSLCLYSLLSTLYPPRPLLTDPYSRTTAEAAPRPTPRSNTPSVRRGRYGWIARSDAPPPRSPADSRRTG